MNKLTLGTAQLGMKYGINNKHGKPLIHESLSILEGAYNHNIKSFDTAYSYGDSEKVLGTWIEKSGFLDINLTSKSLSLNKQKVHKSQVEKKLRDSLEHSLRRMHINKLNHYLIHDFMDVKIYGDEIFKVLEKLKKESLIDRYGCSIYDMEELEYISDYEIGSIQIPGNILNRGILDSKRLGQMKKEGTSVFVRSVFLQGLFFMNIEDIPKPLKDVKVYLQKLRTMVKESEFTIADVALNYVRNHPNTDSVVFGVESLNQLTEIISINKHNEINPEVIKEEFSGVSSRLFDPRYWG